MNTLLAVLHHSAFQAFVSRVSTLFDSEAAPMKVYMREVIEALLLLPLHCLRRQLSPHCIHFFQHAWSAKLAGSETWSYCIHWVRMSSKRAWEPGRSTSHFMIWKRTFWPVKCFPRLNLTLCIVARSLRNTRSKQFTSRLTTLFVKCRKVCLPPKEAPADYFQL